MNTKWFNNNHKNTGIRITDTPISIAAAREEADDSDVYCENCHCNTLVKDKDYLWCTRCKHTFDIKQEVETGKIVESDNMDDNAETLVSTMTPDPNEAFLNRRKVEPQGGLKALQDRGIRITSYTETGGDGKTLKRNRWS